MRIGTNKYLALICFIILALVIGYSIGWIDGRTQMQDQASLRGYGELTPCRNDPDRQIFRWVQPERKTIE